MRRVALPLGAGGLVLGGCAKSPLGYLDSAGPAAHEIAALGWGLLAMSVVVALVVGGLLLGALWRPRAAIAPGALVRANDATPIRWILFGCGVSSVLLLVAAVWTLVAVRNVTRPAAAGLVIDVTGHQWWWEVHYRSEQPSRQFTTANEFVIPVGVLVQVNLRSADVIHSFWVPKLAGKTDAIPGVDNVARIQADRPGVYRGQCTEFCGKQHANMAFFVRAVPPADFQAWWSTQLADARADIHAAGAAVFLAKCAACHAVRGLPAGGIVGPDLSHFGARSTIGAGELDNTMHNLAAWITDPQAIKPATLMPNPDLTPSQVAAVTTFLEDLK